MSTISYEPQAESWDGYEDEQRLAFSSRPRRRFFNPASALLLALVLGAAGFYAGVRVEKGQLSSSSAASGAPTAGGGALAGLASRLGGSASAGGGRSGFPAGAGGFAAALGGGNSSFGTVSSIDGKTIYVTETASGDVVKVSLSSATKITKSVGVAKSAIRPGDSVVIQGVKGSGGTIAAASLSDSGARSSGSSGSSGSSSGGAGSAVNQLFGGGG
jgi:hypothetical protein